MQSVATKPPKNFPKPPFKYVVIIEPLGLLYGSAGRFLSPENLVGRSGTSFPPTAATLSGIFATQLRDKDQIEPLLLAGPFWALTDNPQNFYVPTPFNCLVKDQQIQCQIAWHPGNPKGRWLAWLEGKWQTPPNDKFEKGTWLPIRHWKSLKEREKQLKVYAPPWKFIPHLHPRLREDERRVVDSESEQGSLFLENGVQLDPDACLVYLSNTSIPDGCYRFGGEGHLVDLRCQGINNCLQDLFNQSLNPSFALITPAVWGSNRRSYRAPEQDGDGNLGWQNNPLDALLTERPHPMRYRLGNYPDHQRHQTKVLSRGRYAVPAGTVYVLEKPLPPWQEWSDEWFPQEGVSFKRWGCGLSLPLESGLGRDEG